MFVECAAAQDFRELACSLVSLQSQPLMSHAQAVAQVQTGLQLQLQFWQSQEAFTEAADLVVFVFIGDGFIPVDGAALRILQAREKFRRGSTS